MRPQHLFLAAAAALALGPAPAVAAPPPPPGSGDVDGDGFADVVVTDYEDSVDSPGATVIFGGPGRAAVPDHAAPGARGLRITGSGSVSFAEIAGDVNGDGRADVVVAAGFGVHVVFGPAGPRPAAVDLDRLGAAGRTLSRVGDNQLAVLGDVTGDGLADLAEAGEGPRAALSVWLGDRSAPFTRRIRVVTAGRIAKIAPNPQSAGAGDVNGDGLGDLAVALPDPDGRPSGLDTEDLVFVVHGSRSRRTVTLGQRRRGAPITVRRGAAVAGRAVRHDRGCVCQVFSMTPAGDLDGDGRGELAIVAEDTRSGRDRLDLVRGSASGRAVTLPGAAGTVVTGTSFASDPVALGDLSGDGRDDLLVDDGRTGYRRLGGGPLRRRVPTAGLPLVLRTTDVGAWQAAGDVDGDGRPDARFARFTLDGYAPWGVLFGAAPLSPLALGRPSAQVMAITRAG